MAPKRKAPAAKKAAPKKKSKAEQAAAASPTVEPEPAQPSRSPQTSKVLRCAPHTTRVPRVRRPPASTRACTRTPCRVTDRTVRSHSLTRVSELAWLRRQRAAR